jgi:hypothetical protein
MIELTESLQSALDCQPGEPLRLVDPRTGKTYVLVPADVYERLKAVADDDIDMRQVGALIERNMREYDAGDPLLELYQQDSEGP